MVRMVQPDRARLLFDVRRQSASENHAVVRHLPQLHVSALKNPANLGGPFINYGTERANEIKALLERTQKEQSHILEFGEAIKALDKILTEEANGLSLEDYITFSAMRLGTSIFSSSTALSCFRNTAVVGLDYWSCVH
jgi:hypothetical protein